MLLRYFSSLLLPSIFEYYTRIHAPLSTSRIVNDPPRHGNLLDLIPSLCFRCVTILVYWRSDWRREFNFIFFDRARLDYVSRKMGRGRKLLFTFGRNCSRMEQERPVIDFNRERCNDAVWCPANNRTASTHLIRSVLLGVEFREHEPQPQPFFAR